MVHSKVSIYQDQGENLMFFYVSTVLRGIFL